MNFALTFWNNWRSLEELDVFTVTLRVSSNDVAFVLGFFGVGFCFLVGFKKSGTNDEINGEGKV